MSTLGSTTQHYAREASGLDPVTHADVSSLSHAAFTWPVVGAQTMTVTVTNKKGAAVGAHAPSYRRSGIRSLRPCP